MRSWVSDFGSPLGADTGNNGPLGPRLAPPSRVVRQLLYGFKAGLYRTFSAPGLTVWTRQVGVGASNREREKSSRGQTVDG